MADESKKPLTTYERMLAMALIFPTMTLKILDDLKAGKITTEEGLAAIERDAKIVEKAVQEEIAYERKTPGNN